MRAGVRVGVASSAGEAGVDRCEEEDDAPWRFGWGEGSAESGGVSVETAEMEDIDDAGECPEPPRRVWRASVHRRAT